MRRRDFVGLTLSTACAIFAYAALVPVQVLSLRSHGASAFTIGLVNASFFVAVIAVSPFVHRLVSRGDHRRVYWVAKALFSTSCLLLVASDSVVAWLGWSLLSGLGAALVWPITESCLAELAPDERKGSITGAYQTALGLAFALGPFAAALAPKAALAPLCALLSLASTLGVVGFPFERLSRSAALEHAPNEDRPGLKRLVALLVACALVGGLYENGFNGVTVLLGQAIGLEDDAALAVPGVIGVGSVIAQMPAGVFADRRGELPALGIAAWAVVIATALTPTVFLAAEVVWPLAVIWGAAGGALYTLAVVAVAKRVDGRYVTHVTGVLVGAYTTGCAMAPSLAGAGFDWSPSLGLTLVFLPITLAFAAGLAIAQRRQLVPLLR